MKAIVCEAWGTPDTLRLAELPLPAPGPGQVRVRVHAAAVNFPDALIVAGKYQFRPDFPFSPGLEFSGTVSAVGEGVAAPAVGDKVVGGDILGVADECCGVLVGGATNKQRRAHCNDIEQ